MIEHQPRHFKIGDGAQQRALSLPSHSRRTREWRLLNPQARPLRKRVLFMGRYEVLPRNTSVFRRVGQPSGPTMKIHRTANVNALVAQFVAAAEIH